MSRKFALCLVAAATHTLMRLLFLSVSARGMDGVHWRFDSEEGLILGETIGVRILQQVTTRTRNTSQQ